MPLTLALHEGAAAALGPRLAEAAPGARLALYDAAGALTLDGAPVRPETTEVDLLWLSPHLLHAAPDRAAALAAAFDLMHRLARLGALETFNAGLDDPRYAALAARGVAIQNSSAQGVAIAEYVMAQVLALTQPILAQRALQAERRWQITPFRELSRTSWLILGWGPIGRAVAARARAFGAKIAVVRRSPEGTEGADRAGTLADLPALLPEADVIVLACPLTAATRGLAGPAFFAAAKPGAILVNVARGGLIARDALLAALDAGRLSAAVLDVFEAEPLPADDPLWAHPAVRVTAHTSFAGDGTEGRWNDLFLENAARLARGEPLARRVAPADLAPPPPAP